MYVNKHPPPLIHTYTYRHSVLYPHTHKIHVLETTSLYNSIHKIRLLYTTLLVLQKPNTVHTVPRTKRHHNNRSQGLWSDYMQLTETNKFQDPPPTPLKNFGTPYFLLHPTTPPNLNSDWSLIRATAHHNLQVTLLRFKLEKNITRITAP